MITYFYKILDKYKNVIYVGVTTRSVEVRFQEHKNKKHLANGCTCITINSIIHPEITDMKTFFKEYKRVSVLEQNIIKEEKDKGSNLINISVGGEWGTHILAKIQKNLFFDKYGTYNGYVENRHKVNLLKAWFNQWIRTRSTTKVEWWLHNWISHRKVLLTKDWLYSWIIHAHKNKTYFWLHSWMRHMTENKIKSWLYSWITHKNENRVKIWLYHWIDHQSTNKVKDWLYHWVGHRSTNKTKIWLICWINHRTTSKIKFWLRNWINHKKEKPLYKTN